MVKAYVRISSAIYNKYVASAKPRDLLPTLRELQEEFSASLHTVTAAVRELMAKGEIVQAVTGRGRYEVASRDVLSQRHGLIGLVATLDANCDMVYRVMQGINSAASPAGLRVVMGESGGFYEHERDEIFRLKAPGCVGVVLLPTTRTTEQLAYDYLAHELPDFPIVVVDIAYPEQRRSAVVFDNVVAGREMARHFLEQGRRRCAFIDMSPSHGQLMHRSLIERWTGINETFQAAGAKAQRWQVLARLDRPYSDSAYRQELSSILDRWAALPTEERPDVMIAPEDRAAAFLTELAITRGITIPDDLVFAGFDHAPIGRMCRPCFVTTAPDFNLAGRRAAELVLASRNSDAASIQWHTLPVPIVAPQGAMMPAAAITA